MMKLALISTLAVLGQCEVYDLNGNVKRYEDGTIVARSDTYCAFYSDSACNSQVGSAHYDVTNAGCFANSGRYVYCFSGEDEQFRLIQSPHNDGTCDCQNGCTRWLKGDMNACWDLDKYLNANGISYRFVNNGEDCAPNAC